MDRRHFLGYGLAGLAGFTFGKTSSFADKIFNKSIVEKEGARYPAALVDPESQALDPHFLVQIHIDAGMDSLIGLDPYTQAHTYSRSQLYLDYRASDLISLNNLVLGPVCAPMSSHLADLLVVRGVHMREDAGHEVAVKYVNSGIPTRFSPLGDVLAQVRDNDSPGILNSSFLSIERRAGLSQVAPIVDRNFLGNLITEASHQGPSTVPSQNAANSPRISFGSAGFGQILPNSTRNVLFIDRLRRLGQRGTSRPNLNREHFQLAIGLMIGAINEAFFLVQPTTGTIDSHIDYPNTHKNAAREAFQEIADLFSYFKQTQFRTGRLFDYTTFVITTDFSRTPGLNAAAGKDHNPYTNSILLAGKGIRGGRFIGSSSVLRERSTATSSLDVFHVATPFDFANQRPDPNNANQFIFPEHVLASVGALFGRTSTSLGLPDNLQLLRLS